jgi:hypothetical protein
MIQCRINNHLNFVLELGLTTAEILSKCRDNGRNTLASFQQVRGLSQANTGAPVTQAHPSRFRKKSPSNRRYMRSPGHFAFSRSVGHLVRVSTVSVI